MNNGWSCLWRGHPVQPTDHLMPHSSSYIPCKTQSCSQLDHNVGALTERPVSRGCSVAKYSLLHPPPPPPPHTHFFTPSHPIPSYRHTCATLPSTFFLGGVRQCLHGDASPSASFQYGLEGSDQGPAQLESRIAPCQPASSSIWCFSCQDMRWTHGKWKNATNVKDPKVLLYCGGGTCVFVRVLVCVCVCACVCARVATNNSENMPPCFH